MNYHQAVCYCFDFFYQKLYSTNYHLDLSINNQRKQVDNFIKQVSKYFDLSSVGSNFLIDYFFFAFAHWSEMNTKRNITLNWIIGKKMFNRWVERKQGSEYYARKFLMTHNIDLDILRSRISHQDSGDTSTHQEEELEKQRMTGQARLYNCLYNTTLYNHLSPHCTLCICKRDCKELLQRSNPALYHSRGYR